MSYMKSSLLSGLYYSKKSYYIMLKVNGGRLCMFCSVFLSTLFLFFTVRQNGNQIFIVVILQYIKRHFVVVCKANFYCMEKIKTKETLI